MTMIMIIFILVALAVIISGSVALSRNVRQMKEQRNGKFYFLVMIMFAVGVVFAIGAFFIVYPYRQNLRIVGFPIPAAAFERHNGIWVDFVGPTTLPFMCANSWFGFVLPHLVLRTIRRRKTS
jgi:hypothetical protein